MNLALYKNLHGGFGICSIDPGICTIAVWSLELTQKLPIIEDIRKDYIKLK